MIRSTELASYLGVSPQTLNNLRVKEGFSEETFSEKDPVPLKLLGSVDTLKGMRNRFFTPQGARKVLEKKLYPFDKKIITVSNLKGGVGKTAVTVHLARMAVNFGFKVLVVDADKQSNATKQLIGNRDFKYCLYNVLTKDKNFHCELKDAILPINAFLSILPSKLENQILEQELSRGQTNYAGYFSRLKKFPFDLVLIDTEPNLSLVNLMALTSSDLNIAPIRLDEHSFSGLQMILGQIDNIKSEWKVNLKTKVLINAIDKRMTSSFDKIADIKKLGVEVFGTAIQTDNNFVKTQNGSELPVKSRAYSDIKDLAIEVLELDKIIKQ